MENRNFIAARLEGCLPASPSQAYLNTTERKPPQSARQPNGLSADPLLTVDDVARLLNVSRDWVWDHSSRRKPLLPVIRMGDGTLRYRPTGIEAFVNEQERMSSLRRRAG